MLTAARQPQGSASEASYKIASGQLFKLTQNLQPTVCYLSCFTGGTLSHRPLTSVAVENVLT